MTTMPRNMKTLCSHLIVLLVLLDSCIESLGAFQFRKSILCESLTGFLSCRRSNDYVLVKKAMYGRTLPYPKVCGDLTGRPECSMDTTATLLPFCFKFQNCTFPNTDEFHGQPCTVARQGKYLNFEVACVPAGDIFPVCGTSSLDSPVGLPLPDQGLLAPPFYSVRKQRPWRCDVRINGASSMTFEVINDDNGRVPVMACGRNIIVGGLLAFPGCRPLSKDQNYTTKGDVNIYFYNTNDTGPQALIYYQVVQKDVLGILTASRKVNPVFTDIPLVLLPPITEGPTTESPFGDESTVAFTESSVSQTTVLPTADSFDNTSSGEDEMNSTSTVEPSVSDDNETIICNNNSNSSANLTDGEVSLSCINVTSLTTVGPFDSSQSESNIDTTQSINTDASTAEPKLTSPESLITSAPKASKTESPTIPIFNQIPIGNSSKASTEEDDKPSAIPPYLVGIIVGVLGFIILLLIIAFIVAVCKRKERAPHEDDMAALSQDKQRSREMNIYSTIDLNEDPVSDKSIRFSKSGTARKVKEDTLEKAKADAKDKTNSTFNPSEIWYEDKVDFTLY